MLRQEINDNLEALWEAAAELRFLLAKGYPRTGALTFVGNHHQLPKDQRNILMRGVHPDNEASARRGKLIPPEMIKGRPVGVDGHNILITLESALKGLPLIDCDDGLIRDVSGTFSNYAPSDLTETALDLALDHLMAKGAGSVVFYLDAPLSRSGEMATQINAVLAGRGIMGRAFAVPGPDSVLATFKGLVATSDSALIDRAAEPLDLAGAVIREKMPETDLLVLKIGGKDPFS